MAIQSAFFPTDGSTRTFTSTKHIATKQNLAVWRRLVSDQSWELAPIASYDLINNGAVFAIAPSSTLYSEIEVRVADNPDELVQSPSDVTIVAGIENEIVTVAGIENEVVTVAGIENEVVTVAGDTIPINTVAGDTIPINQTAQDSVVINTVAGDTLAINDLASDPMRSAILDVSSEPVRQAVLDAEGNANDAQLEAWVSEAEAMTSESNAKEAEDVFTKTYTSNGDGTFTSVNNAWYSSLHYSLKAQQEATTIPSKTSARNSVISAVNGANALATTPTPSHIDVTYIGNGTAQDLNTGTRDGIETVANGTFDTDLTGWTNTSTGTGTASVVGGKLQLVGVTSVSNLGSVEQTLTLVVGNQYQFKMDNETKANTNIYIDGVKVLDQTPNDINFQFTATNISTVIKIEIYSFSTCYYDNVSVQNLTNGLPSISRPWVASASYTLLDATGKDTLVTHDYVIYKAKTAHSGVATTPDLDATNWEAIADGVHLDADNADVWIKNRSSIASNQRFDSLRGIGARIKTDSTNGEVVDDGLGIQSFNIDGFSITDASSAWNASGETYIAWAEYFDKMFSWVDDDGFRGITAYNAQSGKFMVSYQGSGVAGKKVWHGLGTKPDFFVVKNRDSITNWMTYDSPSGATHRMILDSNTASTAETVSWNDTEPTNTVFTIGTRTDVNTLNANLIAYGSSNRTNHSYVGGYVGTGLAGNEVNVGMDLLALDTAGKNIKVMIKSLSATGNWLLVDSKRVSGINDGALWANLSDAEIISANIISYSRTGVVFENNTSDTNTSGTQYLIEVTVEDFDNPNGGLDLNPTTTSYADGSNATGDADVTATTIASATYPQIAGTKNYFYSDFVDADTVTLGSTDVKLLEGLNRVDADKWGVVSPSDATLKTTDKHNDYASGTGVVSASGEYVGGYVAWKTFDGILSGLAWTQATTGICWVEYDATEKRVLKSWRIASGPVPSARLPRRFTIQGSDDGVTWFDVDATYQNADYVPAVSATWTWGTLQTVVNTTGYKVHRLYSTANNGDATYTEIGEIEFNTEHQSGDFYNVAEGVMYGKGAELITNGTFDTDTNWTKGIGWAIGSGVATKTGVDNTNIEETIPTVSGKTYIVEFEIKVASVGLGIRFFYGSTQVGGYFNTVGRHTVEFTASTIALEIKFNGVQFDGGSIDNISVKQLDTPIKRVYTAEADVDGSNEIIPDTWVDRAIKNQNFTDVTVHGDAEFLGGFDLGQSRVDVTADRILGVTYTNNTRKPIEVSVNVFRTGSPNISFYINDELVSYQLVAVTGTHYILCTYTIQVGATYKVISNGTMDAWTELR